MRDPAPWQRRYDRLLIMSLLLGLAGQYLFVGKAFGVSVPLFVLGFYGLFFYAAKGRIGGFDRWQGQSKTGWLLLIPIALLSLAYALFANELFRILNVMGIFLLMVAQTMLVTRGGSQPWHRVAFHVDLWAQWLVKPFAHLPVPFGIAAGWFRSGTEEADVIGGGAAGRGDGSGANEANGASGAGGANGANGASGANKVNGSPGQRRAPWRRIGLGLFIAAPLLIVIIALLGSADSIFMSWINRIPSLIDGESLGNGIIRLLSAAIIALYAFCYIWGVLFRKEPKPETDPEEVWRASQPPAERSAAFDPVTAATVLVCVNLVYLLFVAIQFSYLFGAADGLLPDGIVYAEYARRGFAELVLVALLNMGLLLVGLHFIAPAGAKMERLRRVLLSLLMLSSVVMLVSAYSRLSLYEEAYGYTHLRLLVHGFMVLLGVLMTVALARIWYGQFSLAKVYIALAIVSYVIMNYANLDARIAVNNIDRYERTGNLDIDYLWRLSEDAGPALTRLYAEHPELEELERIVDHMRKEARHRSGWQSWNWALHRLKE